MSTRRGVLAAASAVPVSALAQLVAASPAIAQQQQLRLFYAFPNSNIPNPPGRVGYTHESGLTGQFKTSDGDPLMVASAHAVFLKYAPQLSSQAGEILPYLYGDSKSTRDIVDGLERAVQTSMKPPYTTQNMVVDILNAGDVVAPSGNPIDLALAQVQYQRLDTSRGVMQLVVFPVHESTAYAMMEDLRAAGHPAFAQNGFTMGRLK